MNHPAAFHRQALLLFGAAVLFCVSLASNSFGQNLDAATNDDSFEPPTIESEFIPHDISSQLKGFRPRRSDLLELSKDKTIKTDKIPDGLRNPKAGVFRFGDKSWAFLVEEPEDKKARLFIDANSDGDFTNDPEVEFTGEKNGKYTSYSGSAKVDWKEDQTVSIIFYRNDPDDDRRSKRMRASMMYYADFGYRYTLKMDSKQYVAVVGGVLGKQVAFEVDRDGNNDINRNLELVTIGKPFNFTGTTYLLSVDDGRLVINEADQPIDRMPLPLNLSVGQTVPEFTATTLDGTKVDFPGGYKGKIVMLDYWALWCSPCIMEIPHMKKAHDQWHEAGFEILGVSLDKESSKDRFAKLLTDKGVDWHQIFEGDGATGRLANLFEVTSVPFVLLVDGDTGKILATRKELRGEGLAEVVGKHIKAKQSKE